MLRSCLLAAAVLAALAPAGHGATATSADGETRFVAEPGEANDLVVTFQSTGTVLLDDAGAAVGAAGDCVAVGPNTAQCPAGDIRIVLGDVDDQMVVSGEPGRLVAFGGPGVDRLEGGAGSERLVGGPGNDELLGGAGNDVLDAQTGVDAVDCGAGADRVDAPADPVLLIGCRYVRFYTDASRAANNSVTFDANPVRISGGRALFRLRCPRTSVDDFGEYTPCDGKLQLNRTGPRHRTVGSASFGATGARPFFVSVPLRQAARGTLLRVTVRFADGTFVGPDPVPRTSWTLLY